MLIIDFWRSYGIRLLKFPLGDRKSWLISSLQKVVQSIAETNLIFLLTHGLNYYFQRYKSRTRLHWRTLIIEYA